MAAATLSSYLPATKNTYHKLEDEPLYPTTTKELASTKVVIPPYGDRKGWLPRTLEDFGDGGAFPEIHIPQYPLNMGKDTTKGTNVVNLQADAKGNLNYGAIVEVGRRKNEIVHSKASALRVKHFTEEELQKPDEEEEKKATEKTRAALEKRLNIKINASRPAAVDQVEKDAKYIRYVPANKAASFNSGASSRIIRMVESVSDPLEPPKFRARKVPASLEEPPVPVMHSPERKPSAKTREAWRIPPCVSLWKNNRGYTIPLEKRLAADGRGLQEVQINPQFAKLSQSLYIAESNARAEVAKHAALQQHLALQERKERERALKDIAEQARLERQGIDRTIRDQRSRDKALDARDELREGERRLRERAHRLENFKGANKSKFMRDNERDISEKIALGMNVAQSQEAQYDQRLFNQSQGIDSGYGNDEGYAVYDKPLFRRSDHSLIFKAPKKDDTQYSDMSLDDIVNTKRFKPHKGFKGTEEQDTSARTQPVQFEEDKDNVDGFGLEEYTKEREKRQAQRKSLGVMNAVGGSAGGADELKSRKRDRVDFESAKSPDEKKKEEDRPRKRTREASPSDSDSDSSMSSPRRRRRSPRRDDRRRDYRRDDRRDYRRRDDRDYRRNDRDRERRYSRDRRDRRRSRSRSSSRSRSNSRDEYGRRRDSRRR